MKLDQLEKVIELVRRHGIHQLEVEDENLRISVTATAPGAPLTHGFGAGLPLAAQQAFVTPPAYGAPVASVSPATPAATPAAKPAPVISGRLLKSPFVGTFYRSPSPGSDAFVDIGKRVKKGDTLCIIEAMKLMNEIEAEFDGVIKEILVDNEQPVEFDQPLFVLE
ncbi:MAG: acetyl-CoA carboxylase biotin carboxyl carrier protein [Deltaproteobacteria bacterium]|nr:acetyl-CoA carboxylase biotin carboxyl carrier protein [Deltaproteobacteria bacterium]